jgi:hypothetical protein
LFYEKDDLGFMCFMRRMRFKVSNDFCFIKKKKKKRDFYLQEDCIFNWSSINVMRYLFINWLKEMVVFFLYIKERIISSPRERLINACSNIYHGYVRFNLTGPETTSKRRERITTSRLPERLSMQIEISWLIHGLTGANNSSIIS